MPPGDPTIFHFTTTAEWQTSREAGVHRHPSLGTEGFLHCSFREQLPATAARHFPGRDDLVVLVVDVARLNVELRCEDTSGHGVFPHLYGPLDLDAVVRAAPMPVCDDGSADWTVLDSENG